MQEGPPPQAQELPHVNAVPAGGIPAELLKPEARAASFNGLSRALLGSSGVVELIGIATEHDKVSGIAAVALFFGGIAVWASREIIPDLRSIGTTPRKLYEDIKAELKQKSDKA